MARVGALQRGRLLLPVVDPVDLRPLRPRVVGGAPVGRAGEDLELDDALGAVAQDRPDAVGAGVAAADHDDVACLSRVMNSPSAWPESRKLFVFAWRNSIARWMPERLRPSTGSSRAWAAPQQRTTASQSERRLCDGTSRPISTPVTKRIPGVGHQPDAPLDELLVELHVRNAVHQEAADPVGPLEDGDGVPGLVQLRRRPRGPPGRSRRWRPSFRSGSRGPPRRPTLPRRRGRRSSTRST